MSNKNETIAINGIRMFTQSWTIDTPVANLILIHGLGEHSGRYAWTAKKMNEAGINVFAFDQRGHGQTEGLKAFIKSFDDHVEDLAAFRKKVIIDHSLPLFIYAHSMGALVTSKYIIDRQPEGITGIVFSGGALKVDPDLSPFLQKISPLVGRLIPKLKTIKLDSKLVSRVPEEINKYDTDPLINHEGTFASTGYQMLKTIKYVQNNFDKWNIPVLIMHGSMDKLIDPEGSKQMHNKIPIEDKELVILEGLFHEIMREPEKEEVLDKMTSWITDRA